MHGLYFEAFCYAVGMCGVSFLYGRVYEARKYRRAMQPIKRKIRMAK